MGRKLGKLFGAEVICDIHIPHDQIWISPKEEALFLKLLEFEEMLNRTIKSQNDIGDNKILLSEKAPFPKS